MPRLPRYTLGEKISSLFIEVLELIVMAGYSNRLEKLMILKKAGVKLDLLKFFLQIAFEMETINNQQMAQIMPPVIDVGKMLGGWQNHLARQAPLK